MIYGRPHERPAEVHGGDPAIFTRI